MSLIPYYLQYVSEICEGTRKAPAGIVLTEQEDLKKALQLQAEITKLGIPAFVDLSGMEENDAGRLEWLKVYGLLLDCEDAANALYEQAAADLAVEEA